MNLSKAVKFTRVINALTASTTEVTSTILDMQGYDGVVFAVALGGTVTTANVTTAQIRNGINNSTTGMTAITSAVAAATAAGASSNNGCLVVDCFRPLKRYVDLDLTRTVANGQVDAVFAIQYSGSKKPSTNDITTILTTAFAVGS